MKTPEEALNEKIIETLRRVSTDYEPSVSDLFNIMRWSRQGRLQVKEK